MKSFDKDINQRIVEMRRNKHSGLFIIHRWLSGWDNFSQLDEMVVLAHILNVLRNEELEISRKEVRRCFNKFHNKEFHGGGRTYLDWMFKEFDIK